ncbi:type II secretion system protein N [uncultured Roseobacter sp.]|uniref:type II secretion system protein N n=1 Tax=uncultured Roseobacter sp. TaxID=114847 RepID=UPI0026078CE0|nr:type II secretion system protein N [uncultured Roseobacter sp.]
MKFDIWHLAQLGLGGALITSFTWQAPAVVRHSFGIFIEEKTAVAEVHRADAPVETLDLSAVLALAPFGRPVVAQIGKPGASTETLPDLELKGILSAANAEASVALIAVAGLQGLYAEGQAISERLSVATLAADHVVVQTGKGQVILRFDEARARDTETSDKSATATSINDRLRAAVVVPDRKSQVDAPETTAEYIAYWRQKIRKNPEAVLEDLGLEPADEGYRIAQKHNPGVRLAGLRAGDLVRSVNGKAVGNPDEDRQAYDEIAAAGQARLEVQRGDKLLTFSFPLR